MYSHAQNLGNECADHAAALGTVMCRINRYALVGHTLRSIALRCLRLVTTLMTSCRYYAMSERHICLLHNLWSEASDLFCTVSLCGLSLSLFLFSQLCDGRLFLAQSLQTLLLSCMPCLVFDNGGTRRTQCGILCWDFSLMSTLAHSWSVAL